MRLGVQSPYEFRTIYGDYRMQKSKRKRFEIFLGIHPRDRQIAAWIDGLPNASEAVKMILAKHIEKEAAENG